METVLLAIPLLACPVGMGLMMLFMGRSQRKQQPAPVRGQSVEEMREEQRRLEDQIRRMERPEQHAVTR